MRFNCRDALIASKVFIISVVIRLLTKIFSEQKIYLSKWKSYTSCALTAFVSFNFSIMI